MKAKGTVHKFGDNVDTDVIIPHVILIRVMRRGLHRTVWKTSTLICK